MATLATLYNRFLTANAFSVASPRAATRKMEDPYALRALANEDIYFYVKDINNSRVVRESDPGAKTECWRLIGSAGTAVVLLMVLLLPSAYNLLAGYQIQNLRAEQQRLTTERSALELQEAKLLSPARLEELARTQSFIDPGPQTVVYLDGKGSVAMNVKK
jgi:hypothetical protein